MPKTQSETVVLNGRVVEKDHVETDDELSIDPKEAEEYECQGYLVTTIGDLTLAIKLGTVADGTITIESSLDAEGALKAQFGYANLGYSGYFKGFVYVDGRRRRIVNWKAIFPNEENRYAAQQDKRFAKEAIEKEIARRAGTVLTKVKGGYAFGVG
jgi:hypothetical protein